LIRLLLTERTISAIGWSVAVVIHPRLRCGRLHIIVATTLSTLIASLIVLIGLRSGLLIRLLLAPAASIVARIVWLVSSIASRTRSSLLDHAPLRKRNGGSVVRYLRRRRHVTRPRGRDRRGINYARLVDLVG
jgi:hypothetical protein